jgi:hypothetical protein
MRKLEAVEYARELMTAGMEWSVIRWLFEKGRVREAADRATEALAEANQQVKQSWNDDLKKAYAELTAKAELESNPRLKRRYEKAQQEAEHVAAHLKRAAQRVKQADDEAYAATMAAEDMFAEAESQMSGDMARGAAQKALESYDLREKAIRSAEIARREE